MMPSSPSLRKMPRNQFTISLKEKPAPPPSWDAVMLKLKAIKGEHDANKNAGCRAILSCSQSTVNVSYKIAVSSSIHSGPYSNLYDQNIQGHMVNLRPEIQNKFV